MNVVSSLSLRLALLLALPCSSCEQQPHATLPQATPEGWSQTALAAGLSYANATTVHSPRDFLRDWPAMTKDGLVHAVVEIPTGATDKGAVGLDGVMRWDLKDGKPRRVDYLGYPGNYGVVPQAVLGKEIGGDGDPLDIVVLGPALPRGTVVPVVLLGAIRLTEKGEQDDKLIAVPVGSPMAACASLAELDATRPGITSIVQTWFENYKGAGALVCQGFRTADEARTLVAKAHESFRSAESANGGK